MNPFLIRAPIRFWPRKTNRTCVAACSFFHFLCECDTMLRHFPLSLWCLLPWGLRWTWSFVFFSSKEFISLGVGVIIGETIWSYDFSLICQYSLLIHDTSWGGIFSVLNMFNAHNVQVKIIKIWTGVKNGPDLAHILYFLLRTYHFFLHE